ncbi:MAG: xanthine/uracil permease [Bacillota bacterium]
MLNDIWLFILAVVFVAINGITQLSYAASLGYALKPTSFAYFVGAIGNLLTGSVTPIAGQAETLTLAGLIKKMGERVSALLIAAIIGIIMGITGSVSIIANFAGPSVVSGMMSGVGLILSMVAIEMFSQEKRTGSISIASAIVIWALTHDVVYTVAGSVLISTIDFALVQKRRVDLRLVAESNGQTTENLQSDDWKFWTKGYWQEFKLIKPIFNTAAILGALSFICLNIGSNTAFGNITASIAGTTQNLDHLTIINSFADLPSILFGGAPIEAIISGTAGAPWPVAAGIVMMLLTGVLLLTGVVGKMSKYVPAQSIAGFLLVIGFVLTFVPNLNGAMATDSPVQGIVALGVTAITKNPFLGMVFGVLARYLGALVGIA